MKVGNTTVDLRMACSPLEKSSWDMYFLFYIIDDLYYRDDVI